MKRRAESKISWRHSGVLPLYFRHIRDGRGRTLRVRVSQQHRENASREELRLTGEMRNLEMQKIYSPTPRSNASFHASKFVCQSNKISTGDLARHLEACFSHQIMLAMVKKSPCESAEEARN